MAGASASWAGRSLRDKYRTLFSIVFFWDFIILGKSWRIGPAAFMHGAARQTGHMGIFRFLKKEDFIYEVYGFCRD